MPDRFADFAAASRITIFAPLGDSGRPTTFEYRRSNGNRDIKRERERERERGGGKERLRLKEKREGCDIVDIESRDGLALFLRFLPLRGIAESRNS